MTSSSINRENGKEAEFTFGTFKLNADGTLYHGENIIHLPPKELAALRFLLTHSGEVVTRTQLKQALWGDVHVTSDSVPRCVSSLRARLECDECIQTVYKRGYRFAGPVLHHGPESQPSLRLAILPFRVSQNVAEHLGPSLSEEVCARLTELRLPSLALLARDSVHTLAQQGLTSVQVGEELKADLVLTATLSAMPTHHRLRAEMIRVDEGCQIWVEDMLVANSRIADLQTELVRRLLFRLVIRFSGAWESLAGQYDRAGVSSDAYELFLRGRQEWQSFERHRMQDGMQHLIHATELDSTLIAAHVDLANVCVTQEFYGFLSPESAAEEIRRIEEAIPNIAANAPLMLPVLGWTSFHIDRDLTTALEMFSLSANLPHDGGITKLRVMFALSRHRWDEALEWLRSALVVDPYAPWLHAHLAWAYHLAGRAKESVNQIERSLASFPEHESNRLYGAIILAFNGQAARAVILAQELERHSPSFDIAAAVHAYALARDGQVTEARDTLERLQWLSRERFVVSSFTAAAYAELGDAEAAIAELVNAGNTRCPWFFQMLADPRLQSLWGRREFEEMRGALVQMEDAASEGLEHPY